MADEPDARIVCEHISLAIVAIAEEALDLGTASPPAGLRSYRARANRLDVLAAQMSALAGALAALSAASGRTKR